MKKQFLTLSIIAALSACSSDNDNTMVEATPAEITGDFTGTATKYTELTGTVKVNDVNPNESLIYSDTITGTYGSFFINAAGEWKYTLDKANEDVKALVSSDMASLVEAPFSFKTVDGSTASVAVTVAGMDVPATFAGGLTYSVVYDDGTASATVTVKDDNPAEAEFAAAQTPTAMYGAVTFDSAKGEWTYDLDETNADVKALNYTEETDTPPSLEDSFIITSLDGTEATVTITVKGSLAVPAEIDGNLAVSVSPDLGAIASGSLTITDPNFGEEVFESVTDFQTTYGSFSITSEGEWRYLVDESNSDIVALNSDSVALTESITVTAMDKTTTELVVTINPPLESLKLAEITHTSGKGKIRLDFTAKNTAGKALYRTKFSSLVQPAEYTLITTKPWDVGYGLLGVIFNPDGSIDLRRTPTRTATTTGGSTKITLPLKNTFEMDKWVTVEASWDVTAAVADSADDNLDGTPAVITLKINGVAVRSADDTTITTDSFGSFARNINLTKGGVDKFLFECGTAAADPSGSCALDDIKVFDAEGELKVYENFEAGTELAAGKNTQKGAKFGSGNVVNAVIIDDN